jgi:hypothetical protein
MAYYALIDETDVVVAVISGIDENEIRYNGQEPVGGSSEAWETYYSERPWFKGLYCKRTSYNGKIRKNYAGIGFTYDKVRDAFIAPKCHNAAVLIEQTCLWSCDDITHTPTK